MLEGKVAFVTGSTRGIGWATARTFASQGASVIVSLAGENGSELTAVVPERSFYDHPFAVGDRAAVRWDTADIRDLQ